MVDAQTIIQKRKTPVKKKNVSRGLFWSSFLGNFFEHYDTALFGFLSPFLAPILFPEQEAITALLLTYAIIPLGMIARPLGALVFGYIGDIYGRAHALFLTLAGMAFVSGCIALCPTYKQAGILVPILFSFGRAFQNFLAAGETMGGAVFLLENSPKKHHDLLSSLYSTSTIGGHLLASWGVFLVSSNYAIDPGWRFLYLFGCVTALFGCMIRRTSKKTHLPATSAQTFSDLLNKFWVYRKAMVFIIFGSGFAHATYSIALVLMNGFIPLITTFSKAEVMKINSYLLIFDFCALPFFGWLASRFSREKLMFCASLGVVLFSAPLFLLLEGASLARMVAIRTVFVIFGVAYFAPFHAWAQQQIPSSCRYGVISFGYAIGSQLLGSPTAALALWSYKKTGMVASVAWYWASLGLISSVSILMASQSRNLSTNYAEGQIY